MGIIQIAGMEFYAFHGCFAEEKITGNTFIVNLWIETDLTKASETDAISDTVNYQTAYELVKQQMAVPSNLLENVAQRIINALYLQFTTITKLTVQVEKLNPPMGGKIDNVNVTIIK